MHRHAARQQPPDLALRLQCSAVLCSAEVLKTLPTTACRVGVWKKRRAASACSGMQCRAAFSNCRSALNTSTLNSCCYACMQRRSTKGRKSWGQCRPAHKGHKRALDMLANPTSTMVCAPLQGRPSRRCAAAGAAAQPAFDVRVCVCVCMCGGRVHSVHRTHGARAGAATLLHQCGRTQESSRPAALTCKTPCTADAMNRCAELKHCS